LKGNYATSDNENNDFIFNGKVFLKDNVNLSTNNVGNDGNITFNQTVDANSTDDDANLTLQAGEGTINMNGVNGQTNELGNLNIVSANKTIVS
jgi:hypothetical protein